MSNSREDSPPAPSVTSTRDLADLARAGYGILRQPFTRVNFEVHHTSDRPGYMRENLLIDRSAGRAATAVQESPMVGESIVSAANGVGMVIGTNTNAELLGVNGMVTDARNPAVTVVVDESKRRIFHGAALPNPTFLFESAATYEGIVSVQSVSGSVKFYQSVAVRDLIREISRIAADVAGVPILFLQVPAQLPAQNFIGPDIASSRVRTARRSSSLAVRFAIALPHSSSQLRFELTTILRQYCTDNGFALWLADTRIGYRTGNWFQICLHDDYQSSLDRSEPADSPDGHGVEVALPITFIGPARIGTTYRIVSHLCAFNDIGIVSCASTTLDDVAFIHLQLSFRGFQRSDLHEINKRLAGLAAWSADPVQAIDEIHDALSPSGETMPSRSDVNTPPFHVNDYQTLAGPALCTMVPSRAKRIAVWFSWQMEGTISGMTMPLEKLFSCFSEIGFDPDGDGSPGDSMKIPNLEYLICRDIGNSVLRGRGKFSIPEAEIVGFYGGGMEEAAVRLCVDLEEAWVASLRRHSAHSASELTVAWREWWLGHWASPI
jgi:hypothetical protein